jgi:hypothetical protein
MVGFKDRSMPSAERREHLHGCIEVGMFVGIIQVGSQ